MKKTTAWQTIDAFAPSLPILSVPEIRTLEAALSAQSSAHTLMARAGRAATEWISANHPNYSGATRHVGILVGPGNNGGDGLVVASHLRSRGYRVSVYANPAAPLPSPAAAAQAIWLADGGTLQTSLPSESLPDCWVDALFGIGLCAHRARPITGEYAQWIRFANQSGKPILALDIPSGLDAETGCTVGPDVIRADTTLTFLALKPGLLSADAADYCGNLLLADLHATPNSHAHLNTWSGFATGLPERSANSHKGIFGAVCVIGGQRGMEGAVSLAARSALFGGAGKVYVQIDGDDLPLRMAQPELMSWHACRARADSVLALGPGLGMDEYGQRTLCASLQAASEAPAIVLDADALNLLAQGISKVEWAKYRGVKVMTPHPLEAARLLGTTHAAVQANRPEAAQELAQRYAAWVILKGHGSIIANLQGELWFNPTGNAALATSGSGDVLTGLLAALLAQGMAAEQACLAACWLHGRAADLWRDSQHAQRPLGLSAGELPRLIRQALVCAVMVKEVADQSDFA